MTRRGNSKVCSESKADRPAILEEGRAIRRTVTSMVVAYSCWGVVGSSHAADEPPPPASGQLEEVVVVAQKRSENLQNVPISVSAVTADALDRKGPVDITELRTLVPALNTTNTNGRLTMSLRGIGTSGVGPGVDNPIALYVDGVYQGSTVAGLLNLNNVQQIEVLKGPQGTLFGRNATGGLVHVITKDPTSTPNASLDFTLGNFDTQIGRFYVSGGKDGFAGDFAGFVKHQGTGWGTNRFDGKDVYDVDHDVALRSKWIFRPFDDGKITLIADYEDSHDTMMPFTRPPGSLSPFVPGKAPDMGWDTDTDWTPPHTVEAGGLTVRVDQDFSSLRFASISAYRADSVYIGNDWDATTGDFAGYYFKQHDHQFSQEFQLSSADGDRLTWTSGLYYFHGTSDSPATLRFAYLGFSAGLAGDATIDSQAIYGQGTYEISPSTHLTLGARYTWEQRKIEDAAFLVYPLFPLTDPVPPPGPGSVYVPDDKLTFDKPTYRIALDHRLSDENMVYASVSTGFKSGGFSVYGPGAPPYLPETLDAYELGLKSDLLDRRVRLNVAAFDYEYKDIQVAQLVFGGYNTTNGGKARSYGLDAELTAAVTNALQITAGVVFTEPKFTEYSGCAQGTPGGGVPPPPGDCAGNLLPLASKITANLAFDYTLPLAAGTLDFNGNAYYNDGFYFEPDNVLGPSSFVTFGASVRWTSNSSGLYLSAFGRNLSNERTMAFAATQGTGAQELMWAEPRTYGLTVGYNF
jgi:iron complex outermembrane receptor protein